MRIQSISLLLMILLTFAGSAGAYENVNIAISPPEPAFFEEFTVNVALRHNVRLVITDVKLNGTILSIEFEERGCLLLCTSSDYDFVAPFGPLPAGTYTVQLFDLATQTVVGSQTLEISGPSGHATRAEVQVEPKFPTDNDNVRLLIPIELAGLDAIPLPLRFERTGAEIDVFVETPPLASPVVESLQGLFAQSVNLGGLEPGTYNVSVHLVTQAFDIPPTSELIQVHSFDVTDAPDLVQLLEDRFEVKVTWEDFEGLTGVGRPVPDPSNESTLFTFFNRNNWELLVKVLPACSINNHFWVLTAAATNVHYEIEIVDTVTGATWTFNNPSGVNSPAVTDIEAFPCSPIS